jgi:hypothetical protein
MCQQKQQQQQKQLPLLVCDIRGYQRISRI